MTIETWCCINDAGESPRQNLPLAKGWESNPKKTWSVFWRVYRRSISWGKFMLVLKYQKDGNQETINLAMNGITCRSYASIMEVRGLWAPIQSFKEY